MNKKIDTCSICFGYQDSKIAYLDAEEVIFFHKYVRSLIRNERATYGKFNTLSHKSTTTMDYMFNHPEPWLGDGIILSENEYEWYNDGSGIIFIYKTENKGFFVYLTRNIIKIIPTSNILFDTLDACISKLNRVAQDDINTAVHDEVYNAVYESETEEELDKKLSNLYVIVL